jgi:hypothetical protein
MARQSGALELALEIPAQLSPMCLTNYSARLLMTADAQPKSLPSARSASRVMVTRAHGQSVASTPESCNRHMGNMRSCHVGRAEPCKWGQTVAMEF